MDLFQPTDKLFSIVDKNYSLLPVMNRFGIRPGFKDKTVSEVCKDKAISEQFFLALINTYNNPDYFPEAELLAFSPLLIVDYLKQTHAYYLNYFLPKLEMLLEKLMTRFPEESNRDLKMISSFYEKYKEEFLLHILDEEENVFPLVIESTKQGSSVSEKQFPVSFEKEHTNMEVKLSDLKNLLIKYLAPAYDDNDFNEFLAALYQFENDIVDHARIEDNILVSQMQEIAKK